MKAMNPNQSHGYCIMRSPVGQRATRAALCVLEHVSDLVRTHRRRRERRLAEICDRETHLPGTGVVMVAQHAADFLDRDLGHPL